MLRYLLASFLLSACFATLASATDGVLEINQACAVETGCFAGDAPGWPVRIAASGSYRLTSNLNLFGPGGALEILSDGVVVDLAGFSMTYCVDPPPGVACLIVGEDDGIEGETALDVTVKNGVIRGFRGWGIDLERRAHVQNVDVRANTKGGIRVLFNSIVEGNRIAFNGGPGASMGLGTAWGNNVLTTNSPDFAGSPTAVAHNLCGGTLCGRVLSRRYYRTSESFFKNEAPLACDAGFRMAEMPELVNPSSLHYDDSRSPSVFGRDYEGVYTDTVGWVATGICGYAHWNDTSWSYSSPGDCTGFKFPVWCIEE